MFDFEKAIAEWRREMSAGGIKSPSVLDELETHLREDYERLTRSGLAAAPAFDAAVARIGKTGPLKAEFKKATGIFGLQPAKLMGIAIGVSATAFSLWILANLFTIHEATLSMRLLGFTAVLPMILAWRQGPRLLPVIHSRHHRTAIGLVCCLAGILWMALFVKFVLPQLLEPPFGSQIIPDRVMASFLWASAVVASLGGVAWGLERAAHRQTTVADS